MEEKAVQLVKEEVDERGELCEREEQIGVLNMKGSKVMFPFWWKQPFDALTRK